MSATGRGATRAPRDYYPTPAWCVHRLLDAIGEQLFYYGTEWLEPAVGDGAIVRAADEWSDVHWCERPTWSTVDIRAEVDCDVCGDFTGLGRSAVSLLEPDDGWAVVMTNPPYSEALAFVAESLYRVDVVVMLLRLGWLASAERAPWLQAHTPEVYVLPDRPSFDGEGTDSADYGWMVWGLTGGGSHLEILDTTPLHERRPR